LDKIFRLEHTQQHTWLYKEKRLVIEVGKGGRESYIVWSYHFATKQPGNGMYTFSSFHPKNDHDDNAVLLPTKENHHHFESQLKKWWMFVIRYVMLFYSMCTRFLVSRYENIVLEKLLPYCTYTACYENNKMGRRVCLCVVYFPS